MGLTIFITYCVQTISAESLDSLIFQMALRFDSYKVNNAVLESYEDLTEVYSNQFNLT